MGIRVISYYRTLAPRVLASLPGDKRSCTLALLHLGNCVGFNFMLFLRELQGIGIDSGDVRVMIQYWCTLV
jgi:hypothetical protein